MMQATKKEWTWYLQQQVEAPPTPTTVTLLMFTALTTPPPLYSLNPLNQQMSSFFTHELNNILYQFNSCTHTLTHSHRYTHTHTQLPVAKLFLTEAPPHPLSPKASSHNTLSGDRETQNHSALWRNTTLYKWKASVWIEKSTDSELNRLLIIISEGEMKNN